MLTAPYSFINAANAGVVPTTTTGSLTFQYLNPTTNSSPLLTVSTSATMIVITANPFTQEQYVSVQNYEPQTGYPLADSPADTARELVPVPEPGTIFTWGAALAAIAIGQRDRRNRVIA